MASRKARSYAIRKVVSGNPRAVSDSYQITLASEIAEQVPEGTSFSTEWHPDGILLRAVVAGVDAKPAWAGGES